MSKQKPENFGEMELTEDSCGTTILLGFLRGDFGIRGGSTGKSSYEMLFVDDASEENAFTCKERPVTHFATLRKDPNGNLFNNAIFIKTKIKEKTCNQNEDNFPRLLGVVLPYLVPIASYTGGYIGT